MKVTILPIFIGLFLLSCGSTVNKTKENKNIHFNIENTMDSAKYYNRKYDPKTGLEMYDFEIVKNSKTNPAVVETYNGWTILIHPMQISGGTYDEYSPANEFQIIQKQFYPNGRLKQKSCFFQTNLRIGIWEYYDEDGNLIRKIDEDEKFKKSKVKLKEVLDLLEKEGWIDQKTGKGGAEIIVKGTSVIINPGFNIMFTMDENGRDVWYASIPSSDALGISYKIDCETGKITKKETPLFYYE